MSGDKERDIPGGADTEARKQFAGRIAAIPVKEMHRSLQWCCGIEA